MIRSEPMTVERVIKVMAAARPARGPRRSTRTRCGGGSRRSTTSRPRRCCARSTSPRPRRGGTERWGDETPSYLKRERRIQRALSEARFVHVIRDGRDTLAAKPGEIDVGAALATGQRWQQEGPLRPRSRST